MHNQQKKKIVAPGPPIRGTIELKQIELKKGFKKRVKKKLKYKIERENIFVYFISVPSIKEKVKKKGNIVFDEHQPLVHNVHTEWQQTTDLA